MAKRHVLQQAEMVRLADILRAHCTKVDDFAAYETGWNDERIAKAHGGASVVNVANLRYNLIGSLPKPSAPPSPEKLQDRIAELEARIARLEVWANKRPVERFVILANDKDTITTAEALSRATS